MIVATLDTARRALSFVAPDDRDVWVRMGMALKAEFGDAAQEIWNDWSQASDVYDAGAARSSWRSFKNGGKIGIGSLFSEAKAKGFKFSQAELEVSPEQLAAQQREREKRTAEALVKRKAAADAAAKQAQSQWRTAAREGSSPYLVRKQVTAESCRYLADGAIIVPMLRYDTQPPTMVGEQQINADGKKKYSTGMDKASAACRLGDVPLDGDPILFCEGYASGLSIRGALRFGPPVYAAFDTSGLLGAAQIVRGLFPSSPFLFCADDDYLTGGKGLAKAQEAAAAVGNAAVVLPKFSVVRRATKADETLPMLTDFNDLHVTEQLDAASLQLETALHALIRLSEPDLPPGPTLSLAHSGDGVPRTPLAADASSPVMAVKAGSIESLLQHFSLVYGKTDVWDSLNQQVIKKAAFAACFGGKLAKEWLEHPERKTKDQRDLPILKGGRALDGGGVGGDPLKSLHQRYVLLYGTETVWDRTMRDVLNLSALRAAYPDLAGRWLDSPAREMRDAKNLVFDPTLQASPETYINMFSGFPLIPKNDEALVEPVLDLLASLCSTERDADAVFVWLLRWLAYPLQHPGAKMQTAVLMFGEKQGTGKSLFFEGVMRPIYGEYGTTAGQHQLESSFTDWKSRKIFVLFEEVLSRDERYSHLGTVKHMITGRDQRINPKGLPERVEANHLNAVFLSNEPQPIPIDLEDRRFLVVEAKAKLDKLFYGQFKALLKAGASAAFYHFLLSYPLEDFNEHTKALDTDAKDRIIKFGLPGWHVFHERWRDGELEAPYCSCVSEDLYIVYSRWCEKAHEKRLSLTKFSELISGRVPKGRYWVTLGSDTKKKMRTVFTIDDDSEDSVSVRCQRFRDLADVK